MHAARRLVITRDAIRNTSSNKVAAISLKPDGRKLSQMILLLPPYTYAPRFLSLSFIFMHAIITILFDYFR